MNPVPLSIDDGHLVCFTRHVDRTNAQRNGWMSLGGHVEAFAILAALLIERAKYHVNIVEIMMHGFSAGGL